MTDWTAHPLCGPRATAPARFWGPEQLDPTAWRGLAALLVPAPEIEALLHALDGVHDVLDVGGGTGLLAQAIAARHPIAIVEPDPIQRAHLPPGFTAIDGRAEALPVPDRHHDAAIATWILQYTADPDRAVAELARVARRRVAIVQAAPANDLVEVYNREAAVAGLPPAHHGWLLARAAAQLEAAGFTVELQHVPIALAAPAITARDLADLLARLHFVHHPARAAMCDATEPYIAARLAAHGALADDGVLLVARRD